jgi:hypothetical protein
MHLWAYVEQTALANQNNLNNHFYVAPGTIGGTLNGLTGARVPIYYCPSDSGLDLTNGTYQRRRGNYVVNWGSVRYGDAPAANAEGPFSHLNGNRSTPKLVKIATIGDGTSNTLMLSETLMATSPDDNDWRGDIHNDDGVFKFMTITTPNSTAPDVVNWISPNPDNRPGMWATSSGSQYSAARSRHTGGVNVALSDGSIRFVSNSVALVTWQALGSMNGGEVVSNY